MGEGYIAMYLRISDDDDGVGEAKAESNSILNQRRILETYISSHSDLSGYPVKEFVDDGISGVSFNRPGVQRLLNEVKEKRVACIVVKDLSRFGRNYIEAGDYIEQIFPFFGVRFIAVSDHFDSFRNPAGLDIGFRNLMHDLYSRDLSRKIKSVKKLMQERGAYSGGDVPYGYMRGKDKGEAYIPDPEAAETVRKIFHYAAEGNTTMQIAGKLNQEKVPTPGIYKNRNVNTHYEFKNGKCSLWTALQINRILRNEVYIGTFIGRKLSTVRPRETKKNEESEYIKLEGHHESLVAEQLFREAQRAVKVRGKRNPYRREANPSPLKGKVRCGCCGYSMSYKPGSGKAGHGDSGPSASGYFYCRMGSGCGAYSKISVGTLEKAVWDVLQKLAESFREEQEACKSAKVQVMSAASRIRERKRVLEMQAENCKAGRLGLYHQWKNGKITREKYMAKKEELTRKEMECKKELAGLEAQAADTALLQDALEKERGMAALLEAEGLTKRLADELIEGIDVYGEGRAEIRWKFALHF